VEGCRQHPTSFTAILQTLVSVTLATNIYPKAKFGFSRPAINIEPLLRVDPGRDFFVKGASQYAGKQLIGKYRAAGSGASSERGLFEMPSSMLLLCGSWRGVIKQI